MKTKLLSTVMLGILSALVVSICEKDLLIGHATALFKKSHLEQVMQTIMKGGAPRIVEPEANKGLQPLGEAPPQQELERIWNYAYAKQYQCLESEYLGGRPGDGDGAYDLCIEKRFWPIRNDPKHKCLMYSFSLEADFSFDNEIARKGCEVHVFDPSQTAIPDGNITEAGVTFHKVGIAHEDIDRDVENRKMRTLKTLLKELKHTNRSIDYLKVDAVDGSEVILLRELLDTGMYKCIRQFAMEVHIPGPLTNEDYLQRCRLVYWQMTQLNKYGWRLYSTTDNVRAMKVFIRPSYTLLDAKKSIVSVGGAILWEIAFVNFDVKGPCILD